MYATGLSCRVDGCDWLSQQSFEQWKQVGGSGPHEYEYLIALASDQVGEGGEGEGSGGGGEGEVWLVS